MSGPPKPHHRTNAVLKVWKSFDIETLFIFFLFSTTSGFLEECEKLRGPKWITFFLAGSEDW